MARRPTSLVDSFLEYMPTSRDIVKVCNSLPSLSSICCGGAKQTTRQWESSTYSSPTGRPSSSIKSSVQRMGKSISQQVQKNPHQTVALVFLVCVSLLLVFGEASHQGLRRNAQITNKQATLVTATYNDDEESRPAVEHPAKVQLPSEFDYLAPQYDAKKPPPITTTPIFWYLPRSGGNTVAEMFGKCRNMIVAGAWIGEFSKLEIIHEHGLRQVTADLTTKEGRNQARDLGLKDANPNMLILSPNVYETSDVFPVGLKGSAELWAWFRHPVERQISMYFWMQSLPEDHPQHTPEMKFLSLGQWAQTHLHQPNAMLATLLGVPSNPMGWTEMDLTIAKNVLREKARIGLLSQKTESVRRFLHGYGMFHEQQNVASGARECQERLLDYAWKTKGRDKKTIGQKSDAYQLLMQSNSLDMKLYDYAVYLFELQGKEKRQL